MYAVIDLGGKQYKVEKGDEVIVDRLDLDEGKTMTVTPILVGGDKPLVAATELKSTKVKAKVEEHLLGKKILVFKYKAKKGCRRRRGHRSRLSRITIQAITGGGIAESKPKAKAKAKAETKSEAGKAGKAEASTKAKAGSKPKAKAAEKAKPKAKPAGKTKPKAEAKPAKKTANKAEKKPAKKTDKKAEK